MMKTPAVLSYAGFALGASLIATFLTGFLTAEAVRLMKGAR